MVNVDYDSNFKRIYEKLDKSVKDRVEKLIIKIISNPETSKFSQNKNFDGHQEFKKPRIPEIGKPMRYVRKDTREVYSKPFRLSYAYIVNENKIIFLDLYHKDKQ